MAVIALYSNAFKSPVLKVRMIISATETSSLSRFYIKIYPIFIKNDFEGIWSERNTHL